MVTFLVKNSWILRVARDSFMKRKFLKRKELLKDHLLTVEANEPVRFAKRNK